MPRESVNSYASIDDLKAFNQDTTTSRDSDYLDALVGSSRVVDAFCGRHFYAIDETRYIGTQSDSEIVALKNDLLSASTVTADSELDWTFDGETWVEGTDFIFWPTDTVPKTRIIVHPEGNYSIARNHRRYFKIVGMWGFGDGQNVSPLESISPTITTGSSTTTTATASAAGVQVGWTLLVGTEQMFVESVSSDTNLTVVRAVNGTTGETHTGAGAQRYVYPEPIKKATINVAFEALNVTKLQGFRTQLASSYQFVRENASDSEAKLIQMIGRYRAPWNMA